MQTTAPIAQQHPQTYCWQLVRHTRQPFPLGFLKASPPGLSAVRSERRINRSETQALRSVPRGFSVVLQRRTSLICKASSEAGSTIAAGQQKYKAGDRMGALKLFDDAVNQDPSIPERQSAHYHAMCVHASYGDVELAQISLRSGLNAGMDFESALSNPDYLRMQASPQIAVQLKRFAAAAKKIKSALQPEASPRRAGGSSSSSKQQSSGSSPPPSAADLASLFDTEKTGLDTSIVGIAKRVAVLLLLLSALGVGLFFIGLKSFNQFQ